MKVRKIVAGLAAVSMLAAVSLQGAVAADTLTISAGEASAKAGETFTLDVELTGVPATGIAGVEFALEYDATAITITDAKAGEIINAGVDAAEPFEGVTAFAADCSKEGSVVVTYSTGLEDNQYWINKDGVFMTLTGTVNADAADGTKVDVKVVPIKRPVSDGSSEQNDEIVAGTIGADGAPTTVVAAPSDGAVSIGESTGVTYGDVNESGEVEIGDVVMLCKSVMGAATLSDQGRINGDVNLDGSADATDAGLIMQSIVKLVELPVQ